MRWVMLVGAFAAMTALTACSGPSTPQVVAVPEVASVPLTSPWKELNLPIDGGVVSTSTVNTLVVRFPATPLEGLTGLGGAVHDSLTASGWTSDFFEPQVQNYFAEMKNPGGKSAIVGVQAERGRPRLTISVEP